MLFWYFYHCVILLQLKLNSWMNLISIKCNIIFTHITNSIYIFYFKFNQVCIFTSAEAAEEYGCSPCRRCRPNGREVTDLEWAGQAERFINSHYQNPLSVNRIAESCHGSSSELQQIFIRIYGVSLMDYLDRVRMDQARYLLMHSGRFIKQISELVGMPSVSEFSRKFKEKEGMTPTLYRRRVRKRERNQQS